MQALFFLLLYGLLFAGVFFITDAAAGFIRSAQGVGEDAVERRLVSPTTNRIHAAGKDTKYELLVRQQVNRPWARFIPFFPRFLKLVEASGTGTTPERAILMMAVLSLILFVPPALFFPPNLMPLFLMVAPISGVCLVLMYLARARTKRVAKFEEQLPDAIDLIVRSLKVGHPLSGAMGVVGRELPTPICTEFALAYDEISYGQDISTTFAKMAERVPLPDLGYLNMAIQIQQESGGNLVESLQKLSGVIRERFRMFRKVRALTAEGRFSAWFLSVFPLVLIFLIQMIKPDYYTQVMNLPIFYTLVYATVVLLLVNVIAMRMITTIKV
jgi:tight adherence protein B